MIAFKKIFIGPEGLRYGWRFLLFLAAIILIVQFCERPLDVFVATLFHVDLNAFSAPAIIVEDGIDFGLIVIVTAIFAWCEGRRVDSYGLPVEQALRGYFWNGAIAGLVTTIAVAIAMIVAGGMQIHDLALRGSAAFTAPILWLIAMLFVGLAEEYLFRGYALQSLWRGVGFWPAALITSALFARDHLQKPHENAIDIGMIFFLAIIICLSIRRTGALWWAVGWHAAFDLGQLFIIGSPNGGRVPVDRLFDVSFSGPAWINGGELGTEASFFMIPAAILNLIYVCYFLRRHAPADQAH
jgi:membrane protease YdiL (CAAX protease family)